MRRVRVFPVILAVVLMLGACAGPSGHYARTLSDAERIVHFNPDSALSLIDAIEPSELGDDSLKAKYYYLISQAHRNQNRPALADSLISFSYNYYKGKDLRREVAAGTLYAWHLFYGGQVERSFALLDSIAAISNLPDSLLIFPLRSRVRLSAQLIEYEGNEQRVRRLMEIDPDQAMQREYRYWLYLESIFGDHSDSAIMVLDDLIAQAKADGDSYGEFSYKFEKIGSLEESGRYLESMALADSMMRSAPAASVQHYLHLWKAVNWFNIGRSDLSKRELLIADSCAAGISEAEKGYYDTFANMLRTVMSYKENGALKVLHMAQTNNRQKEYYQRTQTMRRESELNAFRLESKRMALKARAGRQASIIIILLLAAALAAGVALWAVGSRRRKAAEAEERAEALHSMVEELKTNRASANDRALRQAMLQQLGIIKMVAEVPTEQNREMLRRISSMEGDTGGSLVNWKNVYDLIDNLYSGFYTWLHGRFGARLSDKEEQIIVLMLAGFSTKEIGVITGQTAATIYVRKSAVRKKLELPEKEDIISFLKAARQQEGEA